jgi:hypothetical protein
MPGGVTTEVPKEVRTYQMHINGEWVASKSAKTFPVYDPSTKEVIAQVPDAGAEDVKRAVSAAKAAFEEGPWSTSTAQERGRVLFRLSEKSAPIFPRSPNSNAATPASPSSKPSTTSPKPPLASNTMAASPQKSSATSILSRITP